MKPSSITKKIEQMLQYEKQQKNEEENQEDVDNQPIEYSQGCKNLSQVVRVRFMGQKISQLEKLELVPQLKQLNISFTNLSKINGLNKLKDLKEAILCNNQIQEISGLEENKQLLSLNLSYNKINGIDNLNHLTKLTMLNLSSNSISLISGIDYLKNLTQLFLESNKIKKIDFFPQLPNSFISIDNKKFYIYKYQLEELSLKDNLIETINPKLFENLKNLQELNLSNNKIRSLEFMNSLPNLEKFSCSNNLIEKAFMKIEFEFLEHLDLSNNQILETKKFGEYFPNLFTLDLQNNNIFTEDELEFVYEMDSLCEIDFSNNLVCTPEYLIQFLRRHPEIDVVNGQIIHSAGHRFEEEMKEVEEEIKEFEKKESILNLTQDLEKDESFTEEDKQTRQILKQHNLSDLTQLLQDIQKEKESLKLENQSFINLTKQLNEEITHEQVKQDGKKRQDRELYGDLEEDENNDEQNESVEENDSEDEINQDMNRYKNLQQNYSQSKLQKFDQYQTLGDENALQGFMTELQSNLSEINASYHAIKGYKYTKKQTEHLNKTKSEQNFSQQDLSFSEQSDKKDELNQTASSFKNFDSDMLNNSEMRSALKNIEKNIIIKKKKIPISQQLSSTLKGGFSTHSASSSQTNIPMQTKPGLPIPRNPLLQKELKEFKKNVNDPEYLKKIGFGNTNMNLPSDQFNFNATQIRASSQVSSIYNKNQMSRTSNLTMTQQIPNERPSSINKQRNFSGNKKDITNKSNSINKGIPTDPKIKREKTENLDNSNIKNGNSQQISPSKSIGILYSNRNSKTKSKLIDAIAQGSQQ